MKMLISVLAVIFQFFSLHADLLDVVQDSIHCKKNYSSLLCQSSLIRANELNDLPFLNFRRIVNLGYMAYNNQEDETLSSHLLEVAKKQGDHFGSYSLLQEQNISDLLYIGADIKSDKNSSNLFITEVSLQDHKIFVDFKDFNLTKDYSEFEFLVNDKYYSFEDNQSIDNNTTVSAKLLIDEVAFNFNTTFGAIKNYVKHLFNSLEFHGHNFIQKKYVDSTVIVEDVTPFTPVCEKITLSQDMWMRNLATSNVDYGAHKIKLLHKGDTVSLFYSKENHVKITQDAYINVFDNSNNGWILNDDSYFTKSDTNCTNNQFLVGG
jgi:hypothetical protein